MGDARKNGPLKGHLICVVPFPEPKEQIQKIRDRFPELKLTYINTTRDDPLHKDQGISEEIWKDVTHLATLSALPEVGSAPKLELIHLISAGTNHIQTRPIYNDTSIALTTSSGIHGPTIAEWVVMTSLVSARNYNLTHAWQRAGTWGPGKGGSAVAKDSSMRLVRDFAGQRIGVLGYGSIGRQVGRLAKAMGMEVFAFTATERKTAESKRDDGYIVPGTGDAEGVYPARWFFGLDHESLHGFLGQDLDVLVVCVPLTEKTRKLMGAKEFEILGRKNAFVVNISRGQILDQDALIQALELFESDAGQNEGKMKLAGAGRKGLRGAALDVADPEPLPDGHPLFSAPNCIVTPHISGLNVDYAPRTFEILSRNLERLERGEGLINEVDRKRGY